MRMVKISESLFINADDIALIELNDSSGRFYLNVILKHLNAGAVYLCNNPVKVRFDIHLDAEIIANQLVAWLTDRPTVPNYSGDNLFDVQEYIKHIREKNEFDISSLNENIANAIKKYSELMYHLGENSDNSEEDMEEDD